MERKVKKKSIIEQKRKIIEIPKRTFEVLTKLAELEDRKLKPYIERVLIMHAWNNQLLIRKIKKPIVK